MARSAKLVAKIFTSFISKLGQCCRDDAGRDAERRSTPKRMEVWCAQIKFAFRVDVPGVYGMPDSSGAMFPTQCRACKSARTQVRIDGFVDTHLCRHLRYCGCRFKSELPAVRSFKLWNSTSSTRSLPSTLGVANSRYSLSLSLSLLHHILSASPTVSSPLVRQRFLFLPAHILHSDLVFFPL